jgi:hypothetical protein
LLASGTCGERNDVPDLKLMTLDSGGFVSTTRLKMAEERWKAIST